MIRLASRSVPTLKGSIQGLIELVPTATSMPEASVTFVLDPRLRSVVLVDGHRRPLSIVDPDTAQMGVAGAGLRMSFDTALNDAASRAMTRDSGNRFEPLLVTDSAGRFVGIVRLERLIQALCASD